VAPDTMKNWRWVASRWPAEQRRADVPFHIHRVLASIADADQRFAVIGEPPVLVRTGERRWSEDEAKRRVGWQVTRPETVQEKVLDLVGACAQFVASAGRIVPGLRGQNYTEDEKATVQRNLARVRAAADWIEGAVATGQITPEDGLARLLAGE
jgi:hypothetical protein